MKPMLFLMVLAISVATSGSWAQSNAPTYADVIAARRTGAQDPRALQHEDRRIVFNTDSNVIVQVTDATGGVRLVVMRKFVMPGAIRVESNVLARAHYFTQRDRLLTALAQSMGDDASALTGRDVTAQAYLAAAVVASNHADRITSGADTLSTVSTGGAAGWAGAAAVAGAALTAAWARRKQTT